MWKLQSLAYQRFEGTIVNFFCCLNTSAVNRSMYGRLRKSPMYRYLGTRWRRVVICILRTLYFRRWSPQYPSDRRLGVPQILKSLTLPEVQSRSFSQSLAASLFRLADSPYGQKWNSINHFKSWALTSNEIKIRWVVWEMKYADGQIQTSYYSYEDCNKTFPFPSRTAVLNLTLRGRYYMLYTHTRIHSYSLQAVNMTWQRNTNDTLK
jgi:hypothetical protein